MKFKVGDHVSVIKDLDRKKYRNVVSEMECRAGKDAVVTSYVGTYYELKFIGDYKPCSYSWEDHMLEEVDYGHLCKMEAGFVVVRRDKSVAALLPVSGGLKLQFRLNSCYCALSDYDSDLTKPMQAECDIMKVYGLSTYGSFDIATGGRPLLWERVEKTQQQIKLEELEKQQREIADEMKKLREEIE